ncbi:MAG TPA: response regulator transcription factor [Candidatus Binatia bacterium]|nr:response regulator transcription factor [Candidatus Binatia bacterium]
MSEEPLASQSVSTENRVIRLLIVEDHQMFAEALARALQDEPDMRVAAICRRLEDAREYLRNEQVDVVLMDYQMPDGDGVAAAHYIREEHPRTRVLVVSAAEEKEVLSEALEAGCSGFVGKSESLVHLPSAIRGAVVGNIALSPGMAAKLMGPSRSSFGDELTPRELAVLRLLAQGRSSSEIAHELFMSESTVRNKLSRINSKLDTHSKLEAVAKGLRLGLVEIDPDGPDRPRIVAVPRPPT